MKRSPRKTSETKRPSEPRTALRTPRAPAHQTHATHLLTPLARTLEKRPRKRPTPLDVFVLARRKWVAGERLDIGQLAAELDVGRATVFRWVGTREQLYGHVLCELYTTAFRRILRVAVGKGADLVADVTMRVLTALFADKALRRFLDQDPEFALRVLTSKSSPVQGRAIELDATLLRELADKGEINPALDIDTLAYIIIRVSESFLYGDAISGREPNLAAAAAAVRILVAAEGPRAKTG